MRKVDVEWLSTRIAHNEGLVVIEFGDVHDAGQLHQIWTLGIQTQEFAVGERVLFWPFETLHTWMKDAGGPLLVALDDHSRITGYILGTFQAVGIATIENIYIVPGFRRRGIAQQLIEEFEQRAGRARMGYIRALCRSDNIHIGALFAKVGYRRGAPTNWLSYSPKGGLPRHDRQKLGEFRVRNVRTEDCAGAASLARQQCWRPWGLFEAPKMDDWVKHPDSAVFGIFRGSEILGLGMSCAHKPTNKASIECLGIQNALPGPGRRMIAAMLVHDFERRGLSYLSAHPGESDLENVGCLRTVGFARQRTFIPYSKPLTR